MRELVKVLGFLLRFTRRIPYSRLILALIVVAGVVGGLANTALLVLINTGLNRREAIDGPFYLGFFGLCLLLPAARFFSDGLVVHLSQSLMKRLRVQLCRQILATPLRRLESLGSHRLFAILTDDVGALTRAQATLPLLFMYLTVLAAGLAYLGWLSWTVLLALVVVIAVAAFGYQRMILEAVRLFDHARETHNHLFDHFRALTQGTKELKIHHRRRRAFVDKVAGTTERLRSYNFKAELIASAGTSWGHMLFFLVVGLIVLVLPEVRSVDAETLTGYTLVILYLITPLQVVLNSLPAFGRAQVAIARLETVGGSLAEPSADEEAPADEAPPAPWRRLELAGVTYSYRRDGDGRDGDAGSFTLGPLDLVLEPGEVVFLTGGNGSGKTTLAKLLVGLYPVAGGEIRVDGEPVTADGRERYRQRFSAVFQDFFLFDELIGVELPDLPDLEATARGYLGQLRLDHKVAVENGEFSTTDLSQGERKRLALLGAYLEDRPIYVFDEWAADQDPELKEVFYRELVPQLKKRNKAVCVISHDDRFYGVADRLVKLDGGRVVLDGPPAAPELPGSRA